MGPVDLGSCQISWKSSIIDIWQGFKYTTVKREESTSRMVILLAYFELFSGILFY